MAAEEQRNSDFYGVMGLKKECTPAELRNAYKKLAMESKNESFEDLQQLFLEIFQSETADNLCSSSSSSCVSRFLQQDIEVL